MVAFLEVVVYNVKEFKLLGVAQLGNEATAAGGGRMELSEWLRSADDEGAASPRKMPGTATGSAFFSLENFKSY